MKHVILGGIATLLFIVGGYFIVAKLYHGGTKELKYEENGFIEGNITHSEAEKLYPTDSITLFGAQSFKRVHSSLERAFTLEGFDTEKNAISSALLLRSHNNKTEIAYIFWDEHFWWRSEWYYFDRNSVLRGEVVTKKGAEPRNIIARETVAPSLTDTLKTTELFFGKDAFQVTFPNLKKIDTNDRPITSVEKLSRGWIIKNSEYATYVARVYWDDSSYWVSDWEHLEEPSYIDRGVFWNLSRDSSWDGVIGSNRGTVIGMMFGALFVCLAFFGCLELINTEKWNK